VNAVFDTNVLIAAFVTEGICSRLLIRGRKKQFDLILCPSILQECEHVLTSKFLLSRNETRGILKLVSEAIHSVIYPTEPVSGICRDPNDNKILACASAAKADYLVTGDSDLLELKVFKGAKIVTPKEFELFFSD
jgi:putative PIN family toxin of toxin-antitoxin system